MIKYIDEKGIIEPYNSVPAENIKGAKTAITTFSTHLFDQLIKATNAVPCGIMRGGVDKELYLGKAGEKNVAVYLSNIGAPAAVALMEEVFAVDVENVIAFGICGALVDVPHQSVVVPDKAFRDEGTSYHYASPSDFISVKNAHAVNKSLLSSGINTFVGGTWTTDGFYRETKTRMEEVKSNGCVAVDMECAALQACADFRGKQFYTFFITADSLAGEKWQPNDILDLKATDATTVAVAAAVKLASEISK